MGKRSKPPIITLLMPIAKLFDVTVDELLDGQRFATDIPYDQHSIKINAHLKKQQKIWKIIYDAAFTSSNNGNIYDTTFF